MASSATLTSTSDRVAAGCAAAFIIVLVISAYWDPSIRVLHVFEVIPYGVAAALCLRRRKSGYALGFAAGAFWLWSAGTLTPFVRNGFQRVEMLIRTGTVDRWDQFIAAPAAIATAGLAVASLWGYARLRSKSPGDVLLFVAALGGVSAFFLALFWLMAPRYLQMYARLFA